MALLVGVEGEVAEGAFVAFAVLVASVQASLAPALFGVVVLAAGVVAAVAGEAAAAAATPCSCLVASNLASVSLQTAKVPSSVTIS